MALTFCWIKIQADLQRSAMRSLSLIHDITIVVLIACTGLFWPKTTCHGRNLWSLNTAGLQEALQVWTEACNSKHRRMQFLVGGLSWMRRFVSRSNSLQLHERCGGLACARLDVEATPSDALVEAGDDQSVCDTCHTNLVNGELTRI